MERDDYIIGVDLGGTNLKASAVGVTGAVIKKVSEPVGVRKGPQDVVSLIALAVDQLVSVMSFRPVAVGCGVPGIVDSGRGIVYRSPPFPEWEHVNMRDAIEGVVHMPVVIDNDANMHAFAEAKVGAGRDVRNMVLLTLGTGIGGGIVLDGKIFGGDRGFAGEVGHITIEPEGEVCNCGRKGCWERYSASRAFETFTGQLADKDRKRFLAELNSDARTITPEAVAMLAKSGDRTAKKMWEEFGRYLGIGIGILINILGVTTFVIGGGIAASWGLFIDAAKDEIARRTYPENIDILKLLPASAGNDAGVIGAALAAIRS